MTTGRKDEYLKKIRTLEAEMVHRELEDIHTHDRQRHNLLIFLLFFLGCSIITAAAAFFSGNRIIFHEDQPVVIALKWAKKTPSQDLQILLDIQDYNANNRKMTFEGIKARITLKPSQTVLDATLLPIFFKGGRIQVMVTVRNFLPPEGSTNAFVHLSGKNALSNSVEFPLPENAI